MKDLVLIGRGLQHHARAHAGVLLGTILASAVLTGALLVGDSVRGSLHRVALQRLGAVKYALSTPHRMLDRSLADTLSGELSMPMAPVLQLRGMAIHQGAEERREVNRVQVLAVDDRFWPLADLEFHLGEQEVALNQTLADALGVVAGDEVSLRIGLPGLLPMDAPLATRSDERTLRARLQVARILSDDELGRFSLTANQAAPMNAFISFASAPIQSMGEGQDEERQGAGPMNLLLAGGELSGDALDAALARHAQPEQLGLRFRQAGRQLQLDTDRIYLDDETARAAREAQDGQGVLTYLVNLLSCGEHRTPYSFITAGPVPPNLPDDAMLINRWLADQLQVEVGSEIVLHYAELQPSNTFVERERTFRVHRIEETADWAEERDLVPSFPGLVDVDRCAEWDLGFPMDPDLLEDKANELYWDKYGPTPKALVSLAAGQEMWGNRFGQFTGVRWDLDRVSEQEVRAALQESLDPARAGLTFEPVREQALRAVEQAMDFGQLFLGMSFFLIVAALMLTGLLFVFGVQQRAGEMGVLLALGWRRRRVRRLMLAEGGAVALVGTLLGALAGMGYTRFLIWGLGNYWQGAVAQAAIQFHAEPATLLTGAAISFVCALAAMALAMRRQAGYPARVLLTGDLSPAVPGASPSGPGRHMDLGLALVAALLAGGIVATALHRDVASLAMPFFGAGALLLLAGVAACRSLLGILGNRPIDRVPTLVQLAWHQAARRRGRSLTVIGLLACGCFLTFAVAAMQEDVTAHAGEHWSGTGGFEVYAEASLPIRLSATVPDPDVEVVALRKRDGDDAGCLNLNHAQSPSLLGVPVDALSRKKAFLARKGGEDLWALLEQTLPDGRIPALAGDADTAHWGLKMKTGVEDGGLLTYRDEQGRDVSVQLVGTLPMRLSVFQGTVLIAEPAFQQLFPSEEGHRVFLLNDIAGSEGGVARWLKPHARAGMDVQSTTARLQDFYRVEATYLAMFLVLGALGLAVGSLGMGLVVLRNLFERRPETALLQAVGYAPRTLRRLVWIEHILLFGLGLGCGILASAVAMQPALQSSSVGLNVTLMAALLGAVLLMGGIFSALATRIGLSGNALHALRNE